MREFPLAIFGHSQRWGSAMKFLYGDWVGVVLFYRGVEIPSDTMSPNMIIIHSDSLDLVFFRRAILSEHVLSLYLAIPSYLVTFPACHCSLPLFEVSLSSLGIFFFCQSNL